MKKKTGKKTKRQQSHRNKPLYIPLDFEKAVEGLINVKIMREKKQLDRG
jgi:hypothetical protein